MYKKYLTITQDNGHEDTYFIDESLMDYSQLLRVEEHGIQPMTLNDLLRRIVKADRDDATIQIREGMGFVELMPPVYVAEETQEEEEPEEEEDVVLPVTPTEQANGAAPQTGQYRRDTTGSTNLERVWYSPKVRTLYVKFRSSGKVYAYFAVPPEVWRDFKRRLDEGGSPGSYYNNYIRKPGFASSEVKEEIAERMAAEAEKEGN